MTGGPPPSPFMARAIALAADARGRTSPNPWVGAVVEREGTVIGSGATRPPGGAHAEAEALASCDPRGGTLYVTLEPCVPFEGKRTPACSDRIVAAGIRRVVVALLDPDPRVAGRGIERLRASGLEVVVGDGSEDAFALVRPYVKHRTTGLPYVIARFAASLDGRIATVTGDSRWVTGATARERVHEERVHMDAILTGSGTVLADDPALTARPGGLLAERQPLRVVLDAQGRVPASARVLHEPGRAVVATTPASPAAWRSAIAATGADVLLCEPGPLGLELPQLLRVLGDRGVVTAWVEAGGTLLGSLFEGGHVDELWAFLAPLVIGGDGLPAVSGQGPLALADATRLHGTRVELLGGDVLIRGYVSTVGRPGTVA